MVVMAMLMVMRMVTMMVMTMVTMMMMTMVMIMAMTADKTTIFEGKVAERQHQNKVCCFCDILRTSP